MFFYVPTAISSNGKEFLHLRVIFACFSTFQQPFQATSRIFFTLESHFHVFFYVAIFFTLFKQRQGISSPSRVIFTCFSTFQQPFQATSRIFFSHLQCTICPQVPPKGSSVPPKCPLVPRFYPKRLSNIWNRETMHHMPPSPP